MVVSKNNQNAPICDIGLKLKKRCYPIERGSGYKYMDITAVINRNNTGFLQKIKPIEEIVFNETESKLNEWKEDVKTENIQEYYKWLDEFVMKEYKKKFF